MDEQEIPSLADIIDQRIEEEIEYIIELRHRLHQRPETKFEEVETSALLADELEKIGVRYKTGYAKGTGIVAHLPATTDVENSESDGREGDQITAIALRADIDALKVEEKTGRDWASQRDGFMHACGHDGHMAIQIGAARILASLDERPNPITLLFQPAEEGGAGAKYMCKDGALKGEQAGGLGPPVRTVYGLHGWPILPLGIVGSKPGPLMAATSKLSIRVEGQQAHAALPHLSRDPIVAAAHVITALQSVVSRNTNPMQSAVMTLGMVSGGSSHNIIPTDVNMMGTTRTFDVNTQRQVHTRIESIAQGVAQGMGCEATVSFEEDNSYPVLNNSPELADHFFSVASNALGKRSVFEVEPWMGGEDFAFYGRERGVKSLFYFLGLRPSRSLAPVPQLHQPTFDFNDRALPIGVKTQCMLALADPQSSKGADPIRPPLYGQQRQHF